MDSLSADGGGRGKTQKTTSTCVSFVLAAKSPRMTRENSAEYESPINGFVSSNICMHDCGGECMRLRSFITNAEVAGDHIGGCGRHDFMFPSSTVYGEVIYVGTSTTQWMGEKNSKSGPDLPKHIWIHENERLSEGNECVDVKERTTKVLVEYNGCRDQTDENSYGWFRELMK